MRTYHIPIGRRTAAAIALVALVAACGGSDATGVADEGATATPRSDEDTVSDEETVTGSPEPVTVQLWYGAEENDPLVAELIEICGEQQPHITIEAELVGEDYEATDQRVLAALAAGEPPDISLRGLDAVGALAGSPGIVDLGSYVEEDEDFEAGEREDVLALGRADDGKQVGIPFQVSVPLLYWNRAHFEAAGLDPEAPPETIEQLLEFADVLTDPASNRVGLAVIYNSVGAFSVPAIMAANGASIIGDGELAFDSPESIAVWEQFEQAAERGSFGQFPTGLDAHLSFEQGQSSMIIGTSSVGQERDEVMTDEFGTRTLPPTDGNDGPFRTFASGGMWVVQATDEARQQAAWDTLRCFLSPEAVLVPFTARSYLPLNPGALDDSEVQAILEEQPYRQAAIDSIPAIEPFPGIGGPDGLRAQEILRDALVQAMTGPVPVADALREARTQIEALDVEL